MSKRPHKRNHTKTTAKIEPKNAVHKAEAVPSPTLPKRGIFTEYIDSNLSPIELDAERQKQLSRISELRGGSAVLAYSADLQKGQKCPVSIDYSDLMPINDQLSVLEGDKLDLIIETPGGFGEIAEDIVKLIRSRFTELRVIVPGTAKSAGTLIAMAGDEILMETVSSLGPIDAQVNHRGKQLSADDILQGIDEIKAESAASGTLNPAYIPILQGMSAGELRAAENAMEFARELVGDWLVKYKFKNWTNKESDGTPISDADRISRANKIAAELSNHKRWKTHGRSIKIADLRDMEMQITDYSENPELADAIRRYRVLVELTFNRSPIYKLFETPTTRMFRLMQEQPVNVAPAQMPPGAIPQNASAFDFKFTCPKCRTEAILHGGIGKPVAHKLGTLPFPKTDSLQCKGCDMAVPIGQIRKQLEAQLGRKIH